ncbi:MAG: hypothetical protein ACKO23_06090 [Gemmataceae bacterium]
MMIFAREISDGLTSLVKKVDEATVKNNKARMGSFVVVCNDDEKMEDKLKEMAKKEGLKKCVLSLVDRKAGPQGYKLHPDAEVTVVLYTKRKTQSQFAFKKGELKDKEIEAILEELPKILPEN